MKTIWKFPIPLETPFSLEMPRFSRILAVAVQKGPAFIWAEVQTDIETETRRFHIVGTGREIPPEARHYVGTWQNFRYVWHLYEERL